MEARRSAAHDALPRLGYVLADVLVYVEAGDNAESIALSELRERLALFAASCSNAIVSAEAPALVVVQSFCAERNAQVRALPRAERRRAATQRNALSTARPSLTSRQ